MTQVHCSEGKQVLEWIGIPKYEACSLLREASEFTGEMK